MNEATILPIKPGTLNEEDKAALKEAGIIVIEHKRPEEVRLIRATVDIDSSDILKCAFRAMTGPAGDMNVRSAFTSALAKVILENNP